MKRPVLLLTVSFCCGIILVAHLKAEWSLIYVFAVLFWIGAAFFLKNPVGFAVSIISLAFLLGALFLTSKRILPARHIARLIPYRTSEAYLIKGIVVRQPQPRGRGTAFVLRVEEVQGKSLNRSSSGKIMVYSADRIALHYGERVIIRGRLYRPWGRGGAGQYRSYLYSNGIRYIMSLKSGYDISRLGSDSGFCYRCFTVGLKDRLEGLIFKYLDGIPAGILDAVILGQRHKVAGFANSLMRRSGTVHILVVSGFHVGLVVFIIAVFLKLLRVPRYWRFVISLPLIITYCLLTGASNPVVRSTVMAVIFITAYLLKRDPDICNSICLAALFILVLNPEQLFDVGFQLSFASVSSIVFLYPRLKRFLCPQPIKAKPLVFMIDSCLVSVSAWLGTCGLIAYHFRIFSTVAVLANFLVVPLAALITLAGFSFLAAALLFPPVAPLFARANEVLIWTMVSLNALLMRIPGACLRLPF
ncbi:MAG: ComEC/Rec2 family competence protein [Candidatus Omnitrophota bacterium]